MKTRCCLILMVFSAFFSGMHAQAGEAPSLATAPWLLAGAPVFDLSISQFRETFNASNPGLALNEFRAIARSPEITSLTRAASKISENLYASTALEQGTLKIKSIQLTWLPAQGREQTATRAMEYMAAMIRVFSPELTRAQSLQKLRLLLNAGKNRHYYAETEGAIRYVVADEGKKGLTFSIEPIKLVLSENLKASGK